MDIEETKLLIMKVIKYQKRLHRESEISIFGDSQNSSGQVLVHPDPTPKLFLYEEGCGLEYLQRSLLI